MADILSVKSIAKDVSHAPRKVSLVASLVRGRTVADALVILEHTPKRAARPLAKAIASAKANALNNAGLGEKSLILESLVVSAGPRLKRFRAGAMGRAKPYQKKTSHIVVVVSGEAKIKKATSKSVAKENVNE